jgi:hypothetical protein
MSSALAEPDVDEVFKQSHNLFENPFAIEDPDEVLDGDQIDTKDKRIVLVSPFDGLNQFFNYQLGEIFEEPDIEIVSIAETNVLPYVDVNKREEDKQRPFWIIDFFLIKGTQPTPKHFLESIEPCLSESVEDYTKNQKELKNQISSVLINPYSVESKTTLITHILKKAGLKPGILEEKLIEELQTHWDRILREHPGVVTLPFKEYYQWRNRPLATYISPNQRLRSIIGERYPIDKETGNFLPKGLEYKDIQTTLIRDLSNLIGKSRGHPELLAVNESYCTWV